MKKLLRNSDDLKFPIVFSIGFHLLVVLFFSASYFVSDKKVLVKPKELKYVKAVVIQKEKNSPKEQEAAKKIEDDRIKEIRRKEQQVQDQKIEEQKRIAAQKTKEEKEKLEKKLEEKKIEDKKKQDALAKQKAEELKKKQEALAKEQALKKQREEREAYLKKMREARQQQEELRNKQQQIEQQQQQMLQAQDQEVLDEYEGQIQFKISNAWQRPHTARNGMSATLQINLMPGGDVVKVSIIKSSGDEYFDLSATQAVWKAAPLPVPSDAGVFTRNYRMFNLKFAPEDLWQ